MQATIAESIFVQRCLKKISIMAAQATDMSCSEEEIDDTYSFTECGSDFEYEGKAGYTTCEPEYSKEDLAQFLILILILIFVICC